MCRELVIGGPLSTKNQRADRSEFAATLWYPRAEVWMIVDDKLWFTGLCVTPLNDGRTWVLLREYVALGAPTVRVPAGFITDFASVPSPFWWITPPWGKHGPAAVVHDFLYWEQTTTRKAADNHFWNAMLAAEVSIARMCFLYYGVRAVGWFAWDVNAELRSQGVDRYTSLT